MLGGRSVALATVRVRRGQPRPPESEFRRAMARDHALLGEPPGKTNNDLAIAGPYAIVVDGEELDEYVVWEL